MNYVECIAKPKLFREGRNSTQLFQHSSMNTKTNGPERNLLNMKELDNFLQV